MGFLRMSTQVAKNMSLVPNTIDPLLEDFMGAKRTAEISY